MADNEGQSDTVSKEAHERVLRERDALKAQLDEATGALGSYTKRDRARAALKDKVPADRIDSIADLVTPHLADVELDAIPEFLARDQFAALYVSAAPPPPPGDGEGEQTAGATEPAQHGFSGPSPANSGSGGPPMGTKEMLTKEQFKKLVDSNNEEAVAAAYKDGLVPTPTRPW